MANWGSKLGFSSTPALPNLTDAEPALETFSEATFNTAEVVESARTSLDFLAGLAMPTVFKYLFPPVFQAIWNWLLSYVHRTRDFSQLAIGLPRGFGKTMLIKIFILYCILFTRKKFILIIAGTQTKANNIVTDIMNMLTESNMLRVFGDWRMGAETDRQDLKRFGFRGRNIILMGSGCQSDIRGITLLNARPDIMIFDDIQTREDADSEAISTKIETWMIGTAMKAKSPEGCLFIFIANMYPTKHSILRKLKHNPTWVKFIAGGILADGTSLWEDLQPVSQLLKEFQNDKAMGREEIFFAEVLNDENASVNNLFDLNKLIPWSDYVNELPVGSFIIIDPSNDKANSDSVSIGYFELRNAKPCCIELLEGRFSPGDTVKHALTIAARRGCRLIAVEANAYQYSLLYWFQEISSRVGIQGIEFVDVYSGALSKNSRILSMFKALQAGEIILSEDVRPAVLNQVFAFSPLRRDNVDGILDLLTYAPKVVEFYGPYIISVSTLPEMEHSAIEMSGELATSPF
jgi:hypothetical protein